MPQYLLDVLAHKHKIDTAEPKLCYREEYVHYNAGEEGGKRREGRRRRGEKGGGGGGNKVKGGKEGGGRWEWSRRI